MSEMMRPRKSLPPRARRRAWHSCNSRVVAQLPTPSVEFQDYSVAQLLELGFLAYQRYKDHGKDHAPISFRILQPPEPTRVSAPVEVLAASGFGKANATVLPERQIQFGLRLIF